MFKKVFMDYVNEDNYNDVNLNFSIDNFLKIISYLTPIQSLNKICLLNRENRKLVFEDDKIKEMLKIGLLMQSGSNQWHYYREILSKISVSEFLSLYDASFLREYFLNSNGEYEYTFFAALAEKNINEVIDFIINDNDLFNDFFDYCDYFCSSFCFLSYNSVKKVILKMKDINRKFDYSFINSLTFDNQCEIINDSEIDDETLVLLIRCMCKKAQNYFFENDYRAL